jgi:hypothetical protein
MRKYIIVDDFDNMGYCYLSFIVFIMGNSYFVTLVL